MTPVGAAVETSIRKYVKDLLKTLRDIPQDVMNNWKPAAATSGDHAMNTFAALAVHTVSAAEFHAIHMVGRKPTDRVRDAEFQATATYDDIETRFQTFLDDLHGVVGGMTEPDFGVNPPHEPSQPPDWTNADWLMHTIDHIALHTGHLQIHRQLWEYESRSA